MTVSFCKVMKPTCKNINLALKCILTLDVTAVKSHRRKEGEESVKLSPWNLGASSVGRYWSVCKLAGLFTYPRGWYDSIQHGLCL